MRIPSRFEREDACLTTMALEFLRKLKSWRASGSGGPPSPFHPPRIRDLFSPGPRSPYG